MRAIPFIDETHDIGAGQRGDGFRVSADGPTKRMVGPDRRLQLAMHKVGRLVGLHLDLALDDLLLTLQRVRRELRIDQDVAQQLQRVGTIVSHYVGVVAGVVSCGERAHLAAHLVDHPRDRYLIAAARTQKHRMFHQVGQPAAIIGFHVGARVDQHAERERSGAGYRLGKHVHAVFEHCPIHHVLSPCSQRTSRPAPTASRQPMRKRTSRSHVVQQVIGVDRNEDSVCTIGSPRWDARNSLRSGPEARGELHFLRPTEPRTCAKWSRGESRMSRSSQLTLQHFAVPLLLAPLLGAYFLFYGGSNDDAQKEVASASAPEAKQKPKQAAKPKPTRPAPPVTSEFPPALGSTPAPAPVSEAPPSLGGVPSEPVWKPTPKAPPADTADATPLWQPPSDPDTPASPFREVPSDETVSPLALAQQQAAESSVPSAPKLDLTATLPPSGGEGAGESEVWSPPKTRTPTASETAEPKTLDVAEAQPAAPKQSPEIWRPEAASPVDPPGAPAEPVTVPPAATVVENPPSTATPPAAEPTTPTAPESVAETPAPSSVAAAEAPETPSIETPSMETPAPPAELGGALLADATPRSVLVDQIRRPDPMATAPETPAEKPAAEIATLAVDGEPASRFLAPPGVLLIENPGSNDLDVHFLVNGGEASLAPGESQVFPGIGPWRLVFHRGGEFGNERRELTAGAYRFRVGPDGWSVLATPALQPGPADIEYAR